MIKFIFLFCLSIGLAIGGQSVVFTPGNGTSVIDPNLAQTQDTTLEFQMHGWSTPSSEANVIGLNGVGISADLEPDGTLRITDVRDTLVSGGVCGLSLVGYTNVLVRIMRNHTAMTFSCEMWNYDATAYQAQVPTIATINSWGFGGGGMGNGCTCSLGFVRVFLGTQPIASQPPTTYTDLTNPNLWSEWKYDGTILDSTTNAHDQSVFVGSMSYAATPNQIAVALPKTSVTTPWSTSIPLRAGKPGLLDGTASYSLSDNSKTATCFWQTLSGPSMPQWSNRNSCSPSVTGLVFGEYIFSLTATGSGGSSTSTLVVGAVSTDDNHVVVYPDDRLYSIYGPTIAFGYNPWSFVDYSQKLLSDYWANAFAINGGSWDYEPDKATVNGVPRLGTAYIAAGSDTVNGVGANFADVFCGGDTTPGAHVTGAPYYITINVPQTDTSPISYYRYIDHCNGQNQIVMVSGYTWEALPTVASPGYSWGTMGICGCGNWTSANNTGSNLNYYDGQGSGQYTLYYRSGLSKPHKTAQWVADHWYRNNFLAAPRDYDLVSAMVRGTIDSTNNPPQYAPWPALRAIMDNSISCTAQSSTSAQIGDARENGSCLMYRAAQAVLDPDSTANASAKTYLTNALSGTWQPRQDVTGFYGQHITGGDSGHTWQVTTGSTTVNLVGGPAVDNTFCGQNNARLDNVGTVSIGSDRVTVTATGVNFITAGVVAGDIFSATGTYLGQTTSFLGGTVASVTDATHLVLAYKWRGAANSTLSFYRIYNGGTSGIWGKGPWTQYFVWATSGNQFYSPFTEDPDNWYICSVNSGGTSLTLDKPYTGSTTTTSYRFAQVNDFNGPGMQPYMGAFPAWGSKMAVDALATSDPTSSAGYQSVLAKLTDFFYNVAREPITGGMLYGYGFTNCVNPDDSLWPLYGCSGGYLSQNQDYAVETFNAFASMYHLTGNSTYRTEGDLMYNNAYAAPGYSLPSGFSTNPNYVDLFNCCDAFTLTKYFGQACVLGYCASWPAERLGGVQAPRNRTVSVGVDPSVIPNAASINVTVTYPSGKKSITNCTSTCNITVDDRQGTATMQMDYLSSGAVVLASTLSSIIN